MAILMTNKTLIFLSSYLAVGGKVNPPPSAIQVSLIGLITVSTSESRKARCPMRLKESIFGIRTERDDCKEAFDLCESKH